jgi:sulfatase modifying factor 1
MKYTALLAALTASLIAHHSANAQGALTPPGSPAESQKSLQEIYDAIQSVKTELAALSEKIEPNLPGMVKVQGGTLPESSQLAGEAVSTFYIGKYEVTWSEWKTVRAWATENGYSDLADAGAGTADDHPVQSVNWFRVVKWLNAKSEMEGRTPVYKIYGSVYRIGEFSWTDANVIQDVTSNGYRLPTEAEWEWAARGGVLSQGYIFSGSNDLDSVAWHAGNSGGVSHPVGTKLANELGIHDMSGNISEWCYDISDEPDVVANSYLFRRIRDGSWWHSSEEDLKLSTRNHMPPDYAFDHRGFRLARSY